MHRRRLDEILIEEGLISETEIRDALLRQKAHGGKFGSHLLYYRHIDEEQLVKALSIQLGYPGVAISNMDIPPEVVGMIPKKVALARRVMPFEYDSRKNLLKVACEDPTEQGIAKELRFVASGADIELHVAAEIALNTAIARYYLGRDTSLDENLLLEIPDDATKAERAGTQDEAAESKPPKEGCEVLLVTDEKYAGPLLQSLLEREEHTVTVVETAEAAMALIEEKTFDEVLVKASAGERLEELADRARRLSLRTDVRTYSNLSSMLLGRDDHILERLQIANLDLFTSLLTSKAGRDTNHGRRVGGYAYRLCRCLGLPDRDGLLVRNAGYIHDIAEFYYGPLESDDAKKIIGLTTKLLGSVGYPAAAVDMLRSMYTDLEGAQNTSMPLRTLGGAILTLADLFCHAVADDRDLTLEHLDKVKRKLRDLSGRMLLAETVEAFIQMVQEEILDLSTSRRRLNLMIFSDDDEVRQPLELRLKNDGFATLPHKGLEEFLELYHRSEPDLIVIAVVGQEESAAHTVEELGRGGVEFNRTPTFLVTDRSSVPALTALLDKGIEDIVVFEDNPDMLVSKIRRIESKVRETSAPAGSERSQEPGAHGRLVDMNLIDLLQALSAGHKSVKISVHADDFQSARLILFLDGGRMVRADFEDLTGEEAVYEAMTWTAGTWSVEPVDPGGIPEPNIETSNESILMEGCRRLDERVKSGHLL
jgi:DNA-binding response OmpR family regulator